MPPTAAANGIHKRADEGQRGKMGGDGAGRQHVKRFQKDDETDGEEIGGDVGLELVTGKRGENTGAEDSAEYAGQEQLPEQERADVPKGAVRQRRCAGGETLSRMNCSAGSGGRNPDGQQYARRRHAIGHAQRPINELGDKAGKRVEKKLFHSGWSDAAEARCRSHPWV